MSYNQQLRAFYKNQGLTGKHLRSALKYDRRRIRALADVNRSTAPNGISFLFLWSGNREGHTYWKARESGGFIR